MVQEMTKEETDIEDLTEVKVPGDARDGDKGVAQTKERNQAKGKVAH